MLVKARNTVAGYERETVPFLGLNRSDNTREGEFSEQKNMSDRRYPYLAPRLPRDGVKRSDEPEALFQWDGHEVVAAGGVLYLDGKSVLDVSKGAKQFAVINTHLIVWPDCVRVDLNEGTANTLMSEVKNMGQATFGTNKLTLEPDYPYSTKDANYVGHYVHAWTYSSVSWDEATRTWTVKGKQLTEIEDGNCEGRYYIPDAVYNESTNSYSNMNPVVEFGKNKTPEETLNEYGVYGKFQKYTSTYADANGVRFTWTLAYYRSDQKNAPIGDAFRVGDVVTVSNADEGYNKENIKIKSIDAEANTLFFEDNTFPEARGTKKWVRVTRRIPALDYICEHENRLWGVSNADKTIYASALGDPNNFYDYSGDSGSYAVAVGSEGDFTGICSYGNAVLCWKERTLHKVLGDLPSNYQTAVYRFSGVRSGAHKSLVNVNETLFFLGVDGVYSYSGNKPSLASRALGVDVLKNGVGGTDGRAYYLSVKNGENWELLSYDTHTGLWTRSDETQVVDFCRVGDDVKFLAGDSVYTIGSGDEQVEWEAVFAPMYETLEGGKQYNRLIFRVEVPKNGWLATDVRFDDGRWIQVGIVKGKSGPVQMPVPLRRCDKFEVRLRGKGDCAVLDMVREFRLRGER